MSQPKDLRHSEMFTIRASEVAPDGRATLPALGYLLQEVAGNNALQLDFDISQLKEKDLTWMLHRLHLQIDRRPGWRETITIETWPSGGDGLRAWRDFRILDDNDREIGRCISYWLMLDLAARRPVRLPESIIATGENAPAHVLPVERNRLQAGTADFTQKHDFRVRLTDLDMNEHVNNVAYMEWALAALDNPQEVTDIDIEYRSECTRGDTVRSLTSPAANGSTMHKLQRASDGETAALARTKG